MKITSVDEYLKDGCGRCSLFATPECKVHLWSNELEALRKIVLSTGLTEEIKWGVPCYTYNSANVTMISAFKPHASISFMKGSLLKDEARLLEKPGPNTQNNRVIRFTDAKQIENKQDILLAYIHEAIELEKAGIKPEPKPEVRNMDLPEELVGFFNDDPTLKEAFEALTPGKQRSYLLHITQAKQASTRVSRIEKCIPKIMEGKGFHDR